MRLPHPASIAHVAGVLALFAGAPALAALETGGRLRVGGDGRGPLSAGLSTYPLGWMRDDGGVGVFVLAGRFSHEPGLFLYRWKNVGERAVPVLGSRVAVRCPADLAKAPPPGTIWQARDGTVFGYWIVEGALVRLKFDARSNAFVSLDLPPIPLPGATAAAAAKVNPDGRAVHRVGARENADGTVELLLSVPDETVYFPEGMKTRRDPAFDPFDGRGIWRGGLPRVGLVAARLPSPAANVRELADVRTLVEPRRGPLFSHGSISFAEYGAVTGSYLGNFYLQAIDGEPGGLVRDLSGRVLRHDYVWTSPLAVPASDGRVVDLIVGGEGALRYYRCAASAGPAPRYLSAEPVLEENALLYTGSLPVVNSVDWNRDGATDLVIGNSEGRLLFFENHGTTASPEFRAGEPVFAAGQEIHVQQGYRALQGPDEARWGYLSPTVVDWNGDGLPDVVASDANAEHYVFLNVGPPPTQPGTPRRDRARSVARRDGSQPAAAPPDLAAAQPLYCDGLDVHGTWRVRPGAAMWGDRMAYVALDDDDEFHLYFRIDDANLADGGKLLLEGGTPIRANFLPAGGTGRAKFTLADWDRDGAMDLLVGTPRHGSVPDPERGLPQSRGLPGATVLWLRNTGTNAAPRFAFPRSLQVHGRPVYFGQHECSVALTDLGGGDAPNLLVGDEEGRIHFYHHRDISWTP
jgi:hypothetical protein